MTDNSPKPGKTYKGQRFVPLRSEEAAREEAAAQVPFNKPGAVSLEVYFAMKGLRNPVEHAGMRAYTAVRRATPQDWDAIFAAY